MNNRKRIDYTTEDYFKEKQQNKVFVKYESKRYTLLLDNNSKEYNGYMITEYKKVKV